MMVQVLYYTWKLCSVVFSHFVMISLVVAYCILGAVTFEKLEAAYEREVGGLLHSLNFIIIARIKTISQYLLFREYSKLEVGREQNPSFRL